MSEAQEPGPLPKISEPQIVPDTDICSQTETPESEENCCGTSKDCKNGTTVNENEEDTEDEMENEEIGNQGNDLFFFIL